MKNNENSDKSRPKGQDELSLKDIDSYIHYMHGLLDELETKFKILPKVDQEGNSECPFAEDLYAEKEEFLEKVEKESRKIQGYLRLVEQEIARCRGNLGKIRSDARSLHLDEAKEKYDAAKRAQETQYKKAIQQRTALMDLTSRTAKVLALARSKTFPGRKPQKGFRPPAGALGGWRPNGSIKEATDKPPASRPSFESEIDDLISLGPLGRKEN
jgi:hypothetical protein